MHKANSLCDDFIEQDDVVKYLNSPYIERIMLYALGPNGTNIQQAAHKWADSIGIKDKTDIVLCPSPDVEVELAMQETRPHIVPVFSLCAVYYDLCNIFFKYGSNYTFLSHLYMRLDGMQLASKKDSIEDISPNALVSTHNSPSVLLENNNYRLVYANSNSEAAKMCYEDAVEACITTESARRIYGLKQNISFGSPSMLFTFGTTQHGLKELKKCNYTY